jgi:hypothetical protein
MRELSVDLLELFAMIIWEAEIEGASAPSSTRDLPF